MGKRACTAHTPYDKNKSSRQGMLNLDSMHCVHQVTHIETCIRGSRTLVAISLIKKLLFITPVLNFVRCMPSSPFISPWWYTVKPDTTGYQAQGPLSCFLLDIIMFSIPRQ